MIFLNRSWNIGNTQDKPAFHMVINEFLVTMLLRSILRIVTHKSGMYFTLLLIFFLATLPAGNAVNGAKPPSESFGQEEQIERKLRHTQWTDMLPHTLEGDYYNEFWSYHIFLEGDLHLHVTFSLANFGSFKSPVSGGKLFVSNFKGSNYHVAREYDLDHLIVDEAQNKIRLHPGRDIYLTGRLPDEHHIYFKTSKDGVSYLVDLDFYDIDQGYTWGDGIFRLENEEMGLFMHIPRASVNATVAINDDTLEVSGTAYMDHTFQTNLSSKVVDKGFRHIAHTGSGYQAGYYLIPKRRSKTGVIGFAITKDNSPVTLEKPEQITVIDSDRIGGRSVPRYVEIVYQSGNRRVLSRKVDFQHVSFLEEIGGIRRRLVRSFLGGEVIEYVGTGIIDGDTPVNYNFFLVH